MTMSSFMRPADCRRGMRLVQFEHRLELGMCQPRGTTTNDGFRLVFLYANVKRVPGPSNYLKRLVIAIASKLLGGLASLKVPGVSF